jgi:hypothetical protein
LLTTTGSPLQYSDHQIGLARPFTRGPVPSGSKVSSRNAPMLPTCPAIAVCG